MRHFTVAEANAEIPFLEKILDEMDPVVSRMAELIEAANRTAGVPLELHATLNPEFAALIERISEANLLGLTHGVGLQTHQALAYFPAQHQGREVCLCWRRGQSAVTQWCETGELGNWTRIGSPAAFGKSP